MDLIVSHTNADFDALASMVAASLLYPSAVMSLPGGADRNVHEFLSLHQEVIHLAPPQDIPLDRVTRLIVVETLHARRLGRFAELIGRPGLRVILYDHHLPQDPTVEADEAIIEPYGANTTLMVTLLRRREIPIDPVQATLFALGVYEDTGSLTFGATTPEDADTVAWLLRQGANLDLVASFINRSLSEVQRGILNQLLATAESHRVHGIQVIIATADAGKQVQEMAVVVHKFRDLEVSDAVFALIQMAEAVLIVARSQVDAVNVGQIARRFGGGGHDRAASATLHHTTAEAVKAELAEVLEREVQPRVTAATLMSYPVRTVALDTAIEDAAAQMLRYGHGGLTVVSDGMVVGIIARRDADRALRHGFGHAPVRAYMSHTAVTVAPQTPLPELERIMIEQEVGRLPVLQEGRLVGIVTRSDILRALHGERAAVRHMLHRGPGPASNIWGVFNERVAPADREILLRIAEIATEMGLTIFLVGGAVRDLLLAGETIDLDILVEGEGVSLAEEVGRRLEGHGVTHEKFHTGTVRLPSGRAVDFATARTEYYAHPAALPVAEHSSVREDLYRRDFTINSMALQLNGDEPGGLLDPFGGSRDLAEGLVRVLHNLSFVEDPTRILRAVRFEARFEFHMEERTEELARHAVGMELLDRVSGQRLREELLQLFSRPYPEVGLRRMDELGVLAALEPTWRMAGPAPELDRLEDALAWAAGEPALTRDMPDPAQLRVLLAFARLPEEGAARLAERLCLRKRERELARQAPALAALLPVLEEPSARASEVDARLRRLALPLCFLLMALSEGELARARIKEYLVRWRAAPPPLTRAEMEGLGLPPGPAYGRVLQALRAAQLDGRAAAHEDALALARELAAREELTRRGRKRRERE